MLSTIIRSSYICAQCRYRILRGVPPRLLRLSLITSSRRNNSTFPTSGPPEPEPRRGGAFDDDMDSLVDSFIESAFSGTSLPPRPAPGIGKTRNHRKVLQTLPDTWEEAGVRPVVAEALSNAYPNTARPTDIQKRILLGLKAGNSVAVRDLPGTGKSFSIAAWVLGLRRAMRQESNRGWSPTTTAFIFVPNADLGIQYYQMIKNLLQASSSLAITSSLDSFVQLLHRRVSEGESRSQIELLSEKPNPHIIIITPETAMDIISDRADSVNGLLDFSQATAFVLDEFDALIPRTHTTLLKRLARILPGTRTPTLTPQLSSVEQLLDWVFGRRRVEASAREMDPIQPQLVLSSATLSTPRMAKFIRFEHPLWIGQRGGSSSITDLSPYDLPKASRLLPIGDESSGFDKIVRAVADNILHYAVAYDISSGFMRDAPIPRTQHWTAEGITQKLEELKVREVEHAEFKYQARALTKELGSLTLLPPESWDMSNSPAKRVGYPPKIAAEALWKLLEHDKWPRNAIAAIGREASIRVFIAECTRLGIDARELTAENWNRDMEKEGRIPIGRTDMLFDPGIRKYYKERNERDACRDATIVWVATSASVRGLDVPGVFHLYVLHRVEKAREYTTYCGRVARWPFPTLEKDTRDPRSLGIEVRRGVGKVVSLLLEDHIVPTSGLAGSSVGHQIIINDGSDRADWSWLEEGLMVAKIGCHFQDYYGHAGECPCGPEVRTPKLIRPVTPPPTPNQNFNLLDAAFGPDPLEEESSFSDPLKGLSSDQTPRDPSEPPPEQPKRVSKEAQLEPSTDLPDLPDMWSLPFPNSSRKPKELQQPNRNSDDGGEDSLWSALKDPAPPSQTPDPLFRSPEEDFRTDQRSHHAQEREASTGANNADYRYRGPLTKSRRDQGRGPGKSEASGRASALIMDAVGELDSEHKSPREQFRPDLEGDSGWGEEAKWLSLTAIDAEEYQDPLGPFKATVHEFDRNWTERPKKSNQKWKDFVPTFVPFGEVGVEPSESEKKAEKVEGKKEVSKEEKKAGKNKGAKAQGEIAEADTEERKPKKKNVAKAQGEIVEADTEKRKPKKKKAAKAQGETVEADTEKRGPKKKNVAKAQGEIVEADTEKRKPTKKKAAKAQGEIMEADIEKRKPMKKKAAKAQGETVEADTEKRKPTKKKAAKAQGETAEVDTEKWKAKKSKKASKQSRGMAVETIDELKNLLEGERTGET